MARVYRAHEPGASSAYLSRDHLAEFPDPRLAAEQQESEAEAEELVDPAALREAVLAEAREEAARLVQEAYEEGLRRGEEAGVRAFEERVAAAAMALESAAQAMAAAREEFLSQLEDEVVSLARGIVARVTLREARTDPTLVTRLARAALEALVDQEEVQLRIHPEDLAALKEQRIQLLDEFPALKRLQIETDETIERGGCLAESRRFVADLQPSELLDNLFEDIFGDGRAG